MGYKYDEEDILAAAVEAVLEDGLSKLSFGRLARRIGIADRSIVYYFPTKADLLTRTAFEIGARFQATLAEAFGDEPLNPKELMQRSWPMLTAPESDPLFAVFFELIGLAAASIEPFDELAPALIGAWTEWLVPLLDIDDPAQARAEACAVVATLDGLLLLHHAAGPAVAEQAAITLGIVGA